MPHARLLIPLFAIASVVAVLSDGVSVSSVLLLLLGLGLVADARFFPARPRASRAAAKPAPAAGPRGTERESALADTIVDPLLVLRGQRIVQANHAATGRFGAHLLGEDVRVALRHPALLELLAGAGDCGAPQSVTVTGLGGAGSWWDARMGTTADGRTILHLVDRTAARAADRTRTDFVANASHELRTPLASILGFVEQLEGEAGDQPALRAKFLGVIGREASRMRALTEDLLSLSRIESERHAPPRTPVSLGPLARAAVDEATGRDPDGRDVTLALEPDVPPVAGDADQLRQLLANLIDNAVKYGRAGTPVRVVVARRAGVVELTVADEGEGIASEHLPRLTERFYRVDAGRSRRVGGTGLGLSIAKHIVERHRGTLRIQSVRGTGTTVTVRLPELVAA